MKRVLSPLSAYLPLLLLLAAAPVAAEDWPTFRHDRLRSGVTSDSLELPLEEVWQYRSRQSQVAPTFDEAPDWVNYPEDMHYTLPMIAVGDAIYFTSVDEGRVVCMDAATTEIRWEFIAGGGVNRTPCYSDGKLYFGSNEGLVYCLNAANGEIVWTYSAAPTSRMLISYGKVMSVWPVVTDVQVDDGVAYFVAGIFPHDGTFVFALNAETGELIWRSSHMSENGVRDSLAPGGHLFLTSQQIWVPKDYLGFSALGYGAGIPFAREGGRFTGGYGLSDDEEFVGSPAGITALRGVVVDGVRYTGNIATQENEEKTELWKHDIEGRWHDYDSVLGVRMGGRYGLPVVMRYDPDLCNVIYAGGVIYHTAYDIDPTLGQTGIYARDPATGEVLWTVDLPEPVNQLIVANGRLLAGTRKGSIYCFMSQGAEKLGVIEEQYNETPIEISPEISTAAEAIVQATGLENGYALVLDCQDAQLPLELAQRTNLYICATFTEEQALATAREAFAKAGLHTSRIVAALVEPGGKLPFPSNFADVVVSDAAIRGGALPTNIAELTRMTKPIRGIDLLSANSSDDLAAWTAATGLEGWETIEYAGTWAKRVRPALAEAGSWTHMYGDAGQTGSSDDGALVAPLGMMWYGPPYIQYGTDQSSLIVNGILVCPDANSLEGFDQYTGRKLWRLEAGSIGIGRGKLAASEDSIYAIYDKVIVRIDLQTGEEIGGFRTPFGEEHAWNWMAVAPDGNTVYGAAAGGLWATEMESGEGNVRWQIGGPEASESYAGNTIMDDGKIFILGQEAGEEMRAAAIAEMRAWFQTQPPELLAEFESQVEERDIRELTCINAADGEVLWRHGVDISNCGGKWLRQVSYGSKRGYDPYATLDMYVNNGVLVIGSQGGADKGWGMFNNGGYEAKALTTYSAETGEHLWYRFANYRSRPVIVGDTIHAEPWAYNLHTGEQIEREHPITGEMEPWSWCRDGKQCGIFSASRHFLFGRSAGVGYHDLLNDDGLYTFWHSRASCWLDCVSGGGMMIKPPMALGCKCQWNMPFTIAMATVDSQPSAAPTFSQTGAVLPVRHLHLDMGGTGDRYDEAGNLWIRPEMAWHPLMLEYSASYVPYAGAAPLQRSAYFTEIENADPQFPFASALVGMKQISLPVTKPNVGAGQYLVRLGFSAPPGDTAGSRVFDVSLNGERVIEAFDIAAEAGGTDIAIWREFTLTIDGELMIDFLAAVDAPTYAQMPLINAVEFVRQDPIGLGLAVPNETWLGGSRREQVATVELKNYEAAAITGRLVFETPAGLTVSSATGEAVSLAAGETLELELTCRAEDSLAEGYHTARVKVVDEAGQELAANDMPVEYIGSLERVILNGDTYHITTDLDRRFYYGEMRPQTYHDKWIPLCNGAVAPGVEGGSAGYLMFGLPREVAPRVQRVRVRLHVSPVCTALLHTALGAPRDNALIAEDYGQLRRLVGPPYPNVKATRYEEPVEVEGEAVRLAPVAWNRYIAEAVAPIDVAGLAENEQVMLALEATSHNGIAYWSKASPNPAHRVRLMVDYQPLPEGE